MYAKIAALYVHAYCRETLKPRHENDKAHGTAMATTIANGEFMDVFDHKGGGTHKYIPTEKLNNDLGFPQGAGVFGYWLMGDGSYLLRTCDGPLCVWSGKEEDKAEHVP